MIELILEIMKILAAPLTDALSSNGAETPEQIEAERQALILAQRRIQEEIARRELPP